jgi:hypothetical protein
VIFSVRGAHGYAPSREILPAVARALHPNGLFVASVLHTGYQGNGPSEGEDPRPARLQVRGEELGDLFRWILAPEVWRHLLVEYGFAVDGIGLLDSLHPGNLDSCRLIRARRP